MLRGKVPLPFILARRLVSLCGDALAAILPMDRRDRLAELLTDDERASGP